MKKKPTKKKPFASGNALLRAYARAVKKLQDDPDMVACATSAGFIIPDGEQDGFQVFVKVAKYSKALLKKSPDTGGLLENA